MSEVPETVTICVTVRCACGEEYEFDGDDLQPGCQTSLHCEDCGRKIAVEAELYVQYLLTAEAQA